MAKQLPTTLKSPTLLTQWRNKKPAKKEEVKTMQGYAKNKRNKILGKDER